MMLPPDSHWTKGLARNKAVFAILRPFIAAYFRLHDRYHYTPYKPKDSTFLLLTNHTAANDHFLNALGVRSYMRFVASDHIIRKGFLSKALVFLVNPIPRRKGASGKPTTEMIKQNLRLGVPVIMYAEGNRSFNGHTGFISPRTGELVKDASGSLITYRIEGAYLQSPRWGTQFRRGPSFGKVVREYSREELDRMSVDEINEAINRDLFTDAYAFAREHPYRYRCAAPAEHLETAVYVCPACEKLGTLSTKGDTIRCECGFHARVNDRGFFEGGRFDNAYDWDMWQRGILKRLCAETAASNGKIAADEGILLYRVEGDSKALLADGLRMTLRHDELTFEKDGFSQSFAVSGIRQMGVVHTSFLYFSADNAYYEVRCDHIFAANKYFALHRMLTNQPYI